MMGARGGAVRVPKLSAEDERLAVELCGEWIGKGNARVCWEHCRKAVRGKGYCAESARVIGG